MTTNSFVGVCPNCSENTCLNNVSGRPPYHNLECWSCGWFSIAKKGFMTDDEKTDLKKDFGEAEEEMELS